MGIFTRRATKETPVAITASGISLSRNTPKSSTSLLAAQAAQSTDRMWQSQAWQAYNTIGEIHFAVDLIANLISRVRFYAAAVDPTSPNSKLTPAGSIASLTPTLANAAQFAVSRLTSGDGDVATLSARIAQNLTVAGECYLVQTPATLYPSAPERWEVRSTDEVIITPKAPTENDPRPYKIELVELGGAMSGIRRELPSNAFIARIWRKHPQKAATADSSLRPVLDACSELLVLNEVFKATALSRLNSGILYLPDGISAAYAQIADDTADTDQAPELEDDLVTIMSTPIQEPSAPSGVVPIMMRGPSDLSANIRYITVERVFDPALASRYQSLKETILSSIDLPKDAVSGVADLKYANAIVVEESMYKAHIEPMLILICKSLTDAYLRPLLIQSNYTPEQAKQITLWFDATDIIARPNRIQDAFSLYDRHAISGQALRQTTSFTEADAPTHEETLNRVLVQRANLQPETAEALFQEFDPVTMGKAKEAARTTAANPLDPQISDLLEGGTAPVPAQTDAAPPNPGNPQNPPQPQYPGEAVTDQPLHPPDPDIGRNSTPPAPDAPTSTSTFSVGVQTL